MTSRENDLRGFWRNDCSLINLGQVRFLGIQNVSGFSNLFNTDTKTLRGVRIGKITMMTTDNFGCFLSISVNVCVTAGRKWNIPHNGANYRHLVSGVPPRWRGFEKLYEFASKGRDFMSVVRFREVSFYRGFLSRGNF